jgi:hypothetical protein
MRTLLALALVAGFTPLAAYPTPPPPAPPNASAITASTSVPACVTIYNPVTICSDGKTWNFGTLAVITPSSAWNVHMSNTGTYDTLYNLSAYFGMNSVATSVPAITCTKDKDLEVSFTIPSVNLSGPTNNVRLTPDVPGTFTSGTSETFHLSGAIYASGNGTPAVGTYTGIVTCTASYL